LYNAITLQHLPDTASHEAVLSIVLGILTNDGLLLYQWSDYHTKVRYQF